MGVNPREWWTQKRKELASQRESTMPSFFIPSATESKADNGDQDQEDTKAVFNDRIARAHRCTEEGVRAGVKAGAVACLATTIPTLAAVRLLPWAKNNVNYTGQALIICGVTIATYYIVTEKTILECSRNASYSANEKNHAAVS